LLCLLLDKIEPPKKNSDCPEWETRKSQNKNRLPLNIKREQSQKDNILPAGKV